MRTDAEEAECHFKQKLIECAPISALSKNIEYDEPARPATAPHIRVGDCSLYNFEEVSSIPLAG